MDDSEPVQVFIRIRPELDDAKSDKSSPSKLITSGSWTGSTKILMGSVPSNGNNTCIAPMDDKSLRLMPPDGVYGTRKNVSAVDDKIYSFDKIFQENSTQEEIYEFVAEQVQATVRGYNTTIFAYGVTGSGKSYTMTGNKQNPGIIPRAIGDIFRHIDQAAAENDVFFFVRLSYVELYNNNFRNLLENAAKDPQMSVSRSSTSVNMSMNGFFSELDDMAAASFEADYGPSFAFARTTTAVSAKEHSWREKNEKIEVRESNSAGVFLSGPNLRFPVTSAVEAFQLIAKGNKHRAVASTNCNEMSSRSHAILTFHVESRVVTPAGPDGVAKSEMRIGKIHLVDLAGSERLAISGAEGETLVETKSINSSLTALGDVLSALSRNATIQTQQQKALRQSGGRLDMSFDRQPPALVPVPYRNSKLTHLLKDSLGGNSKTIMITNIRQASEYYQQTAISLMYAARAKKVRNRTTINRNVIGDSGIYAVNTEFERLKKSMEDRSKEFERLKLIQMKDAKENMALKMRLQEMKFANDGEKKLLEQQVSKLIHSQAGYIANQKDKINQLQNALQDELTISQNRIAEQEQEIKWLKKALDETNNYASKDQIDKMQHVIDVWQNQAKTTHQELTVVLSQAEELKTLNATLLGKINELESTKKQLHDEVEERSSECADVTNKLLDALRERERQDEKLRSLSKAVDEAKALHRESAQYAEQQDAVLKENQKIVDSLQGEVQTLRERSTHDAQTQRTLTARVNELERDKSELGNKLTVVVDKIEKKAQQMVEDAQQQIKLRDALVRESEEKHSLARVEIERLREEHERVLQNKQKALDEAKAALQRESQTNAKQSSRLLAAEGEVEGLKDKIARMAVRSKEKSDAFSQEMQGKERDLLQLENDLHAAQAAKETEKQAMLTEFEQIVAEKLLQHNHEIEELKNAHDEAIAGLRASFAERETAHRAESKAREERFKERLREAEQRMRQIVGDEAARSVDEMHTRHSAQLQQLTAQLESEINRAEEQARDAQSERERLQNEHDQALNALRDELRAEKERLQSALRERNEESERERALALEEREKERAAHEVALNALKNDLQNLQSVLAEHGEEREKERNDLETSAQSERERLRAEHEKALNALTEELRAEIERLQKALDQRCEETEKERALRVELERYAKEERERLQTAHDLAINALQNELHAERERLESALREHGEETESERALRVELERTAQTERERLQNAHDLAVNTLKDELRAEREKLQLILQEHGEDTQRQAALRNELETTAREEKERLIAAHEEALNALQDELRERLQNALNGHREEIERQIALRDELEKTAQSERERLLREERDAAHRERDAALDSQKHALETLFKQTLRDERARWAAQHDDALSQWNETLSTSRAQWESERNGVVEAHKRELAAWEDRSDEMENFLREEQRKFSIERERLQDELRKERESHVKERESQREAQREEREKALLSLRESLQGVHSMAIERKEREFAQLLQCSLQEKTEALQREREEEVLRLEREKTSEMERALSALREEMENALSVSLAERERARAELNEKHKLREQDLQHELEESVQRWERERDTRESEFAQREKELIAEREERENAFITELTKNDELHAKALDAAQRESQRLLDEALQKERDALATLRTQWEEGRDRLTKERETALSEKDDEIAALQSALSSLSLSHKDELHNALLTQQKALLDKTRAELDKMRAELGEASLSHQRETTELVAAHALDAQRQRERLEAAHALTVDTLRDELRAERERLQSALRERGEESERERAHALEEREKARAAHEVALNALKNELRAERERLQSVLAEHGEESERERAQRVELKTKLDDAWQTKLDELRETHAVELEALSAAQQIETQRLRAQLERVKSESERESAAREEEHNNAIAALRERNARESEAARVQHEAELQSLRNALSRAKEDELSRASDTHRDALQAKTQQISDLEEKLRDATRAVVDLSAQSQSERLSLVAQCAAQRQAAQDESERLTALLAGREREWKNIHRAALSEKENALRVEWESERETERASERAEREKDREQFEKDALALRALAESLAEERESALSLTHAAELEKERETLAREREQREREKHELLAKHVDELRALESLRDRERAEWDALREEKERERECALRDEFEKEKERLRDELDDALRERESEKNENEREKERLLEELRAAKDALQRERDALRSDVDATRDALQRAARDAETKIALLETQYSERERATRAEERERRDALRRDWERESENRERERESAWQDERERLANAAQRERLENTQRLDALRRDSERERERLQDELRAREKETEKKLLEKALALDNAFAELSALRVAHSALQRERDSHENALQTLQSDLSLSRDEVQRTEKEREKELADLRSLLEEKERDAQRALDEQRENETRTEQAFQRILQESLEKQRRELQEEHQQSIRSQMDLIVQMIQAQQGKSSEEQLQEMQKKFLDLVQDLPDLWKQKHGVLLSELDLNVSRQGERASPARERASSPPQTPQRNGSFPKTPIRLLANAITQNTQTHSDMDIDVHSRPYFEEAPLHGGKASSSTAVAARHQPWSSPSLRASPTDQLIAAILDGDVQGIRAIVRSKGEDLQSEFWHDLTRSVLPLHRAIAGLHFHGSEKLLVATMEVLVALGADVGGVDHAGNSALHKAIPVCTSKSVAAVVRSLLKLGANPSMVNKEGDTPLHTECKRIRTASAEVIQALVAAGANPNVKNQQNLLLTPLSLVLFRAAATTSLGSHMLAHTAQLVGESMHWNGAWPQLVDGDGDDDAVARHRVKPAAANHDKERTRQTGRRVWIKAAQMLIESGARWDPNWRAPGGITQLHLLVAAFPPYREESGTYRALLKSALEDGVNPTLEDDRGRHALFVLCEAMASVSAEQSPDSSRLVHLLVEYANRVAPQFGVGGADRLGRRVFDLDETVSHSCLTGAKTLLAQYGARGVASQQQQQSAALQARPRRLASASYDWDAPTTKSRVPPALLAAASANTHAANGRVSSRVAPQNTNSHHSNNHGRRPSARSDYLDDVDDDDEEPWQQRERERDRAGFEGSGKGSAPVSTSTAIPAYSPIAMMRRK